MIDARKWIWIPLVTFALGLGIGVVGSKCDFTPSPKPPVVVTTAPDAAVYVYEKDDTAIPSEVKAAMSKLNSDGLTASFYEDDTPDGSGDVPEQFKAALEAARKAGLPALVVLGKGEVLKVVKEPKSEAQVLEAVK